jgi:hypothetical protein
MHLHAASKASAYALPPNDALRSHRELPLRIAISSRQNARSKLQKRHVLIVHAAAAFQEQSIPGKGIGLVAARDIAAGSEVLREPALIAFTTHTDTAAEEGYALQDALSRLTQRQQATYNGLANSYEGRYPHVRQFSLLLTSCACAWQAPVCDTPLLHIIAPCTLRPWHAFTRCLTIPKQERSDEQPVFQTVFWRLSHQQLWDDPRQQRRKAAPRLPHGIPCQPLLRANVHRRLR